LGIKVHFMKSYVCLVVILLSCNLLRAQENISDIINAGLVAAQNYSESYLTPAGESFAYNLSTGWYDDAQTLEKWQFNVSIKGQATFSPSGKKSFLLDPMEYERMVQESYDATNNLPARIEVSFADGSRAPREIATALGSNTPVQFLLIRALDGTTGAELDRSQIELAQGLESEGINLIPAFFVQAGVGLGNGLELKARFVPKIQIGDAETSLYGAGLQWEVTRLFENNGNAVLPVRLAVLVGYTGVNSVYDYEDGLVVDGTNQKVEATSGSLTVAAIASTRFKVLNFYGGVNYARGT
jgi:hypothetical protein